MSPTPAAPLWQWSACDLAGAIRAGDVSADEAVGAVIDRVQAENPRLNAIVEDLSRSAKETARQYDDHFAAHGPLGPLHGVPVTIKVNVDQTGHATTNGVSAFKDVIAPDDAPIVRNLKNAGAIVIGRTNTPEFSFRATTDNPLHGRTLNPWDDARSPGGSSGGASAALAAGFGPLAHGNDIGGSLRFPAFMCGLATIRPTFGRVPAYNPSAPAERSLLAQMMSTQGVIAREMRDVRLGTRVLAAPDPRDPWQAPVPFDGPALNPPIKVAVARATNGYAIDPAVTDALDRAAETLAAAGYRVEEVAPPMTEALANDALASLFGDCRMFLGDAIHRHGSPVIQQIFDAYYELYHAYGAEDLLHAMARRTAHARAWNLFAEEYPLVLSPFMMRPGYDWDEDTRGPAAVRDIFDSALYSWTMNFLGLPSAIAPAGFAGAFPMSVQIIARRFREDLALDAAEVLERANGVAVHELWRRQGMAV
ncbi:MAG: amidase [Pseudomonadota bacterium]|nr:amidase [Pseudomonadota bacterium]MEC8027298.1 amidase [Pseudomonadota bacterium]